MRQKSDWNTGLPDTTTWGPRADPQQNLTSAFATRCGQIEQLVILRSRLERELNIDNFDSGPANEDILREQLGQLLPSRYQVRCGVVNDRAGNTAGDVDALILNQYWFPAVKSGATENSRRWHHPVDALYAAVEIKQSIDFQTLDAAMEKLVVVNRLERPEVPVDQVTENFRLGHNARSQANPVYSAIIGIELGQNVTMEGLVKRFCAINRTVPRSQIVRALCVFGADTVTWAVFTPTQELVSATFSTDAELPLVPVLHRRISVGSAFYPLVVDLMLHLNRTVLVSERGVAVDYGLQAPDWVPLIDHQHVIAPEVGAREYGTHRAVQEFMDRLPELPLVNLHQTDEPVDMVTNQDPIV